MIITIDEGKFGLGVSICKDGTYYPLGRKAGDSRTLKQITLSYKDVEKLKELL